MSPDDHIGFLKYEGKLVEEGILDTRSAVRALTGFDSALRYFVTQERPDLASVDFPIPVRIKPGSWEALIPTTVGQWILTAAGVAGAAYLSAAAKQLAEADFKNVSFKDLLKKSLKQIQLLIELGKHLGHVNVRHVTGLKWDRKELVGVSNEKGEVLYVAAADLKKLSLCPPKLLSDIVSIVENERSLVIGVNEGGKVAQATVLQRDRHIFFNEEETESETLFPELTHGMHVELEGVVTRGNEMANTLGFWYNNHVLTCIPASGSIVRFKRHLFLRCKIVGDVTRFNKSGQPIEARPKIRFENLIILSNQEELELFSNEPDDE